MKNIMEFIGQLFIVGFKGEKPDKAFLDFVHEAKIGGVIFFAENCPSHQQAKENIEAIKAACDGYNPIIAIDQEGGRVSRLTGAPVEIKSAFEYGSNLGLEKFTEDYSRSMVYLESLGFNLNLAPVCDIITIDDNDCLDSRCFGRTVNSVIPFVERAVEISKRSGLLSCLKHFPGLGSSSIDPHTQTATAEYNLEEWDKLHKLPFIAGAAKGADMIMTTHLLMKSADETIVTGSDLIIQNLLRDKLAFYGPVITDDLTMKGADVMGEIGQRTVDAFNAGHDLLLFGNDIESSMKAYESISKAYTENNIYGARIKAALDRIYGLKYKLSQSISL